MKEYKIGEKFKDRLYERAHWIEVKALIPGQCSSCRRCVYCDDKLKCNNSCCFPYERHDGKNVYFKDIGEV